MFFKAFSFLKKYKNYCIRLKENVSGNHSLNIIIFIGSQIKIGTSKRVQKIYQGYGILTKTRNLRS